MYFVRYQYNINILFFPPSETNGAARLLRMNVSKVLCGFKVLTTKNLKKEDTRAVARAFAKIISLDKEERRTQNARGL